MEPKEIQLTLDPNPPPNYSTAMNITQPQENGIILDKIFFNIFCPRFKFKCLTLNLKNISKNF